MSRNAHDAEDWRNYYVNRFVDHDMVMHYHSGLAVGHTYTHISRPAETSQTNSNVDPGPPTALPPIPGASNSGKGGDWAGGTDGDNNDDDNASWTKSDHSASDLDDGCESDSDSDLDLLVDAMYESEVDSEQDIGMGSGDFQYDGYEF
ncbi:hypothetical protein HYDPIDRAFT_33115 [Hydnomerulius pinastri MD-312]|uniref:Unplaced genomic scaffold scaffold_52, whole genome shotgun sequence n=1 Tax=Hydnomerulius pinastri MD-312 TaxID=994086 RepID=A0A0C9V2L8_9AGAM|nr:hypothetical protein HYDPIDRAFT_33115 [Hydnomerulius pinastri MD-312]